MIFRLLLDSTRTCIFALLVLAIHGTAFAYSSGTVSDRWGDRLQPAPPAGRFTQITAGRGYTCGIDEQEQQRCWGLYAR
jgi:hypothetical protein